MTGKSSFSFEARHVEKPWGYELIWADTERYVGKLLFVRAGHALSLQYHERKDEAWLIQGGRASLELGTFGDESSMQTVEVVEGDAFRYLPGTVHRITAIEDTTILEVSTPDLDDVVRLEDRYGRPERDA